MDTADHSGGSSESENQPPPPPKATPPDRVQGRSGALTLTEETFTFEVVKPNGSSEIQKFEALRYNVCPDSQGDASLQEHRRLLFRMIIKNASSKPEPEKQLLQYVLYILTRQRLESLQHDNERNTSMDQLKTEKMLVEYLVGLGRDTWVSLNKDSKLERSLTDRKDLHPFRPENDAPADVSPSDEKKKFEKDVAYARRLVKVMVPDYCWSLGPIPNPALWDLKFTKHDLEELYRNKQSAQKVKEQVKINAASGQQAPNLPDDAGTLAHMVHLMLFGLLRNDAAALSLVKANECLLRWMLSLKEEDHIVVKYVKDLWERLKCGRTCSCATAVWWENSAPCAKPKHQWATPTDLWTGIFKDVGETGQLDSIKGMIRALGVGPFMFGIDAQGKDARREIRRREKKAESEVAAVSPLHEDLERFAAHFQSKGISSTALEPRMLFNALGICGRPSSLEASAESGYDYFVRILSTAIFNFVKELAALDKNSCDFRRYLPSQAPSSDRIEFLIQFQNSALCMDVFRKDDVEVLDIGLRLDGWYSFEAPTKAGGDRNQNVQEIKCEDEQSADGDAAAYGSASQSAEDSNTPAALMDFLARELSKARRRALGGRSSDISINIHHILSSVSIVLKGFYELDSKILDIVFTVKAAGESAAAEIAAADLDITVLVNNSPCLRCTRIPVLGKASSGRAFKFLRFGIQYNKKLNTSPDRLIAETAFALGTARLCEQELETSRISSSVSIGRQISPFLLQSFANLKDVLTREWRNDCMDFPVVMQLLANTELLVLGVSLRELALAKEVLHGAQYLTTYVPIDEYSFESKRNVVQNLANQAAPSFVELHVQSPILHRQMQELLHIADHSSVRFLIVADRQSSCFFRRDRRVLITAEGERDLRGAATSALDPNCPFGQIVATWSAMVDKLMQKPDPAKLKIISDALRSRVEDAMNWKGHLEEELKGNLSREVIFLVQCDHKHVRTSDVVELLKEKDLSNNIEVAELEYSDNQVSVVQRRMAASKGSRFVFVCPQLLLEAGRFYLKDRCVEARIIHVYKPYDAKKWQEWWLGAPSTGMDDSLATAAVAPAAPGTSAPPAPPPSPSGQRPHEQKVGSLRTAFGHFASSNPEEKVTADFASFVSMIPLCSFLDQFARIRLYFEFYLGFDMSASPNYFTLFENITERHLWGCIRQPELAGEDNNTTRTALIVNMRSQDVVTSLGRIRGYFEEQLPVDDAVAHDLMTSATSVDDILRVLLLYQQRMLLFVASPAAVETVLRSAPLAMDGKAVSWVQELQDFLQDKVIKIFMKDGDNTSAFCVAKLIISRATRSLTSDVQLSGPDVARLAELGISLLPSSEGGSIDTSNQILVRVLLGLDTTSVRADGNLIEQQKAVLTKAALKQYAAEGDQTSNVYGTVFVACAQRMKDLDCVCPGAELITRKVPVDGCISEGDKICGMALVSRFTAPAIVRLLGHHTSSLLAAIIFASNFNEQTSKDYAAVLDQLVEAGLTDILYRCLQCDATTCKPVEKFPRVLFLSDPKGSEDEVNDFFMNAIEDCVSIEDCEDATFGDWSSKFFQPSIVAKIHSGVGFLPCLAVEYHRIDDKLLAIEKMEDFSKALEASDKENSDKRKVWFINVVKNLAGVFTEDAAKALMIFLDNSTCPTRFFLSAFVKLFPNLRRENGTEFNSNSKFVTESTGGVNLGDFSTDPEAEGGRAAPPLGLGVCGGPLFTLCVPPGEAVLSGTASAAAQGRARSSLHDLYRGRAVNVEALVRVETEMSREAAAAAAPHTLFAPIVLSSGAECWLREHVPSSMLEICLPGDKTGSEAQTKESEYQLLHVFKTHHEAWLFCRNRIGPASMFGRGFFFYKGAHSGSKWNLFIGYVPPLQQADVPTGEQPKIPRTYGIWHIAGYYKAIGIPLHSQVAHLLQTICRALFFEFFPKSSQQTCDVCVNYRLCKISFDEEKDKTRVEEEAKLTAFVLRILDEASVFLYMSHPTQKYELGLIYNAAEKAKSSFGAEYKLPRSYENLRKDILTSLRQISNRQYFQARACLISPSDPGTVPKILLDAISEQYAKEAQKAQHEFDSISEETLKEALTNHYKHALAQVRRPLAQVFDPLKIGAIFNTLSSWQKVDKSETATKETARARNSFFETVSQSIVTKPSVGCGTRPRRLQDVELCRDAFKWDETEREEPQAPGGRQFALPEVTWVDFEGTTVDVSREYNLGYIIDGYLRSCVVDTTDEAKPSAKVKTEVMSAIDAFGSWLCYVLRSPLNNSWKETIAHHSHVLSAAFPANTNDEQYMVIAYALCQMCPTAIVRPRLLGLFKESPTPLWERKALRYGVLCTEVILEEWWTQHLAATTKYVPVKDSMSDEKAFHAIISTFSEATTHVVVLGKPTISDSMLKWCCEYTFRFPWRYIVLVGCDTSRNLPENRDRVISHVIAKPACVFAEGEVKPHQFIEGADSTYKRDVLDYFPAERNLSLQDCKLSDSLTQWSQQLRSSVATKQLSWVFLVSPPGTGKTTFLRDLEFESKLRPSKDKQQQNKEIQEIQSTFIFFDCSDDRLVTEPVVALLNEKLEDVQLGVDDVILVADEFHLLPQRRKDEFYQWIIPRLNQIKMILISNRTDERDKRAEKDLPAATGDVKHPPPAADDGACADLTLRSKEAEAMRNATWYLRAPHAAIVSTVKRAVKEKPLVRKSVAVLESLRLLLGDAGISLRLAQSFRSENFGSIGDLTGTLTAAETALLRMHPMRQQLIVNLRLLSKFDFLYSDMCDAAAKGPGDLLDLLKSWFSTPPQIPAGVSMLLVTAMFPYLLGNPEKTDAYCQWREKLLTFPEFVARTSGHSVHPAFRLHSWMKCTVQTTLLMYRSTADPPVAAAFTNKMTDLQNAVGADKVLESLLRLQFIDLPDGFPLISGEAGSAASVKVWQRIAAPPMSSVPALCDAAARHVVIDWVTVKKDWEKSPVNDVGSFLQLLGNASTAGELDATLLACLTAGNLFALLLQELRALRQEKAVPAAMKENEPIAVGDAPKHLHLLRKVLSSYPVERRQSDSTAHRPFFLCIFITSLQFDTPRAIADTWKRYCPNTDLLVSFLAWMSQSGQCVSSLPTSFLWVSGENGLLCPTRTTQTRRKLFGDSLSSSAARVSEAEARSVALVRAVCECAAGDEVHADHYADMWFAPFLAPFARLTDDAGNPLLPLTMVSRILARPREACTLWGRSLRVLWHLANDSDLLPSGEDRKILWKELQAHLATGEHLQLDPASNRMVVDAIRSIDPDADERLNKLLA